MSEFIVYGIPGSPFMRAVLAALEDKGAAYELKPVAPGDHRGDASGLLPAGWILVV